MSALAQVIDRLRQVAGGEIDFRPGGDGTCPAAGAVEIRAGGRLAGHLLSAGGAAPAPPRLEAAASLLGEWLERQSETEGLADELAQAYEQICLGHRLAESVSSSSDLQQIGERFLDDAARLLGARAATLKLRDAQGGECLSLATRASAAAPGQARAEDWVEAPVLRLRAAGEPEEMGVLRAGGGRAGAPFGTYERRLARSLGEQAGVLLHLGRVVEQARLGE